MFERRVPSTSVGAPNYASPLPLAGEKREILGARGSLSHPPSEHADAVTCLAVTRLVPADLPQCVPAHVLRRTR